MSNRLDLGPKPYLGYTASLVERAAELRSDFVALGDLQKRPDARAYLIAGEMVILKKASPVAEPLFAVEEMQAFGETAETAFIGFVDNAPRFAGALDPAVA